MIDNFVIDMITYKENTIDCFSTDSERNTGDRKFERPYIISSLNTNLYS